MLQEDVEIIKNGSVGTTSSIEYIDLDSNIIVGKFEKIEESSNPLASKGDEGKTTESPGKFANQECKLLPCCGPWPQPFPITALIVSGKFDFPDDL